MEVGGAARGERRANAECSRREFIIALQRDRIAQTEGQSVMANRLDEAISNGIWDEQTIPEGKAQLKLSAGRSGRWRIGSARSRIMDKWGRSESPANVFSAFLGKRKVERIGEERIEMGRRGKVREKRRDSYPQRKRPLPR